ncbi:RNA polymerase sigma factor [Gelidibacter salicanalis]|uniref:RNA polymerase sigma factor n=1 Tax=Gelidibacter salicanalis TaxID=291193 RepID=UPI0027DC1AE0|nr:sigma-70 family RNA polymerase sigma factor [Gelidibacter salicanalis]
MQKKVIEGLKKGDELAYKRLYKLYYFELCTYLNTLCGSKDISKDLSQQAFIKVWKKKDSLSIKYSLKKYILKIGYNLYQDLQRKNKKDGHLIEQLKYEAINELIEISDDELDKNIALVISEVNKLPEKCKNVFLLAKKDGLKYSEISEELNISIKTVERHMTKALKQLRKSLKNNINSCILFYFLH